MILCDTGPLLALLEPHDPDHARCIDALKSVRLPLLTTWPCFTEAMYLLGKSGWEYQNELWNYQAQGILMLRDLSGDEMQQMRKLMEKYRDTPMDLADASLVSTAESLRLQRIFTLDSDFLVYRLSDGGAFEIIP